MDFNFKIPQSLQKKTNVFGGSKEKDSEENSQTQSKFTRFLKIAQPIGKPNEHTEIYSNSSFTFDRKPKLVNKFSLVRNNKDGNEHPEHMRNRRTGIAEGLGKPPRLGRRVNKAPPGTAVWTRKPLDAPERTLSPENFAKRPDHQEVSKFVKPAKIRLSKAADLSEDQVRALSALFALKGKICATDFERFELLRERDKLLCDLRQATEKTDASGKARQVMGLCTAMCSERERYTRIVQKRLSPFECDQNGSIIEQRMVKDYARSAADQEKPLAHELRTKEMLHASLSYLLLEIFDKMPEQNELAGWYDFLWSRTRALRKEVTQLMLSDETAILLVENCTRFHILCAYQLCTLPVDQFDERMNRENLGKCLQTLRHLYDDLEKKGIFFETEAEFRAYDVMLHFHDSNVLRQVLSYRKEVRESKPVRLAIQLASALQNKNYVRFFRLLINEATFLQCCVCHRVFQEIRGWALSVMVGAYQNCAFDIDTIIQILGFDDRETCIAFLEECNLQVESESDYVVLHKEFFKNPHLDSSITYKWIDHKNDAPLSKVVYGPGVLTYPEPAEIPNSFDANGAYTKDVVLNRLIAQYSDEVMRRSSDVSSNESFEKPKLVVSHNPYSTMITHQAEKILDEVIQEKVKSAAEVAIYNEITEALIDNSVNNIFREILVEEFDKEKAKQVRREKEERELNERLRLKCFAKNISENALDYILMTEMNLLIQQEIKIQNKAYLVEASDYIAEEFWNHELNSIIEKELKLLINKTLIEEEAVIDEGLNKFRDGMYRLWLKQFWDTWRDKVRNRKKFREHRAQQWDSFEPNFNCKYFSPSNYINSSKISSKTKNSHTSTNSSLQLALFKQKRRTRICRNAFEQWKYFCSKRKRDEYLARALTHSNKRLANILKNTRGNNQSLRKRKSVEPSFFDYEKSPRLSTSFVSMDDNDRFFSFIDENDQRGSACSTPILNSTALTYHTCTEFRAPTGLSIINYDQDDSMMNNSVLSAKDLSFARRALEKRIPYTGRFMEELGSSSFSLPPSAKSLIAIKKKEEVTNKESNRIECVQLLDDAKLSKDSIIGLEKKAADLQSSLLAHQAFLDNLIRVASNTQSRLG